MIFFLLSAGRSKTATIKLSFVKLIKSPSSPSFSAPQRPKCHVGQITMPFFTGQELGKGLVTMLSLV